MSAEGSSTYNPLPSDLADDEKRFLELVAPFGLDWIKTRREFAARLGIGRYCDWKDVVTLPPCSAISDAPLELRMYADAETMDLPPEYLFADYMFGVFTVELHTFPPQLQDRFARANPLYKYDPRLTVASSISLESSYAFACPDASLLPVAALVQAAGPGVDSDKILNLDARSLAAVRPWRLPSRRYSRRNPRALARLLRTGRPVAWVHPAGPVGLSMRDESLVAPRTPGARVVLVRIEPGRGPGGSVLELDVRPEEPGFPQDNRIHLLDGDEQDSLDVSADLLSTFWELPLAHETATDD